MGMVIVMGVSGVLGAVNAHVTPAWAMHYSEHLFPRSYWIHLRHTLCGKTMNLSLPLPRG